MSWPLGFEDKLHQALPEVEVAALLDSMQWQPHTCVRINPDKPGTIDKELIATELAWGEDAFVLKDRPLFAADPAFHCGHYYVQESSSTIIGAVVRRLLNKVNPEAVVLDLCAAPGGKSTHIASVLRSGDLLVANEVIRSRVPILLENLNKWGTGNYAITQADSRQFSQVPQSFDIIVADMPCSGEGMFRKDIKARDEWSEANVELCSARQQRISHDIWDALKPGGFLIYSTCTFNRAENEDNVNTMIKALGGELATEEIPAEWNLYSTEPGLYRLLPHRHPGEGFFFAIIQKTTAGNQTKTEKSPLKIRTTYAPGLDLPLFSIADRDELYFIKDLAENHLNLISRLPGIFSAGTPAGKVYSKKNQNIFKPEAALALLADTALPFPVIKADDSQIMNYLERGTWLNSAGEKGIHLVQWNQVKAGFMNGVNRQWNNLWPMEWRLRKPLEQPVSILLQ